MLRHSHDAATPGIASTSSHASDDAHVSTCVMAINCGGRSGMTRQRVASVACKIARGQGTHVDDVLRRLSLGHVAAAVKQLALKRQTRP